MKKIAWKRLPKTLRILIWLVFGIYFISGLLVGNAALKDDQPFHGWLYYWDGPYKGKIVELETGAPIEGAIVAGNWALEAIPWSLFCDAVETATDKNGEFVLPKAWCISFRPLAQLNKSSNVVVFKPGCLAYPPYGSNMEKRLSRMPKFTGDEFRDESQYYFIELGRATSREERINAMHKAEGIMNYFDAYRRLPMLLELVQKENKELGFDEPHKKGGHK
jgi:hypothetical protein